MKPIQFIFKYVLLLLIALILLNILPTTNLQINDQILIVVVLILFFVSFDHICLLNKEKFDENQSPPIPAPEAAAPVPQPKQEVAAPPPIRPKQEVNSYDKDYNEMKYTNLPPGYNKALGEPDETVNNQWDQGDVILNTDRWSIPEKRPPVCIQEKECPVCPMQTPGYPINVKQFHSNLNRKPSDALKINTNYVDDRLNN